MKIAFKEKDKDNQFYRNESGEWIKCDEEKIDSLWREWVLNKTGLSIKTTEDGFTVYDYKQDEKQTI